MPQSNGNLSGLEVAAYLHAAGFGVGNNVLQTAIAIAKSESNWNPRAVHRNSNGSTDYGLMQINSVHKPTTQEKTDPLANARKAFSIYSSNGHSFHPWSTYNSGAYKANMEIARESVVGLQNFPTFERDLLAGKHPGSDANPLQSNVGGTGIGGFLDNAVSSVPNAITAGLGSLNTQFAKIGSNILAITLAVAFLVLGIVILSRNSIGGAAGGVAGSVVKGIVK